MCVLACLCSMHRADCLGCLLAGVAAAAQAQAPSHVNALLCVLDCVRWMGSIIHTSIQLLLCRLCSFGICGCHSQHTRFVVVVVVDGVEVVAHPTGNSLAEFVSDRQRKTEKETVNAIRVRWWVYTVVHIYCII